MDYVPVLYVGLGVIGAVLYLVSPSKSTVKMALHSYLASWGPKNISATDAAKQLALGAIVGFLAYLVIAQTQPAQLTSYLAYITVVGAGYAPQDFLNKLFGGQGSGGGNSIPLTGKGKC